MISGRHNIFSMKGIHIINFHQSYAYGSFKILNLMAVRLQPGNAKQPLQGVACYYRKRSFQNLRSQTGVWERANWK